MTELARASVVELLEGYATDAFRPTEAIDAAARRIEAVEPVLRAFFTTTLDEAAAAAEEAAQRWRKGTARPLEGVPFAAKDLFDTARVRTTYGSPMFAEHVPATDAEAVRLLEEAGAILVGKTSTHEFAWGITGYNGHFGTGRNPWRLDRVAGGSSAGSAAALAADEIPLALGTDTGGSIRIPAAFCGVVGLKPSYGRVSAAGVFALSPSLDHVGLLARTPADARLAFDVLTPSSLPPRPLGGLRIGTCPDLVPVEPAPAARRAVDDVVAALADLGCKTMDVRLGSAVDLRGLHSVIQQVEAVRTHRSAGLWPARRDEYGDDVGGRFAGAESVSFEDYVAATIAREALRTRFDMLFEQVDLVVTPASPCPPPEWGRDELDHLGERRLLRDLVLPGSTPVNVVGLPACTVRAGFDDDGLPVGVQLAGPRGSDLTVLETAAALHDATPDVQRRRPDLA